MDKKIDTKSFIRELESTEYLYIVLINLQAISKYLALRHVIKTHPFIPFGLFGCSMKWMNEREYCKKGTPFVHFALSSFKTLRLFLFSDSLVTASASIVD